MVYYKLLDWIDESKLNLFHLNYNSNSIDYLLDNPDKIKFNYVSLNRNAYHTIITNKNFDNIEHYMNILIYGSLDFIKMIINDIY